MAKKKGKSGGLSGLMKEGRANVREFENAAENARMSGHSFTRNQIEASSRNQLAGVKRARRTLGDQNARLTARGEIYARTAKRAPSRVKKHEGQLATTFGGIYSGLIGTAYKPAMAQARGSSQLQERLRRGIGVNARANRDAIKIAKTGVKEAKASADYMLNRALAIRAGEDAAMAAQMEHELLMQKMAYQQQWSMWKKQQDYLAKQAEGGFSKEAAKQILDELPVLSAHIREIAYEDGNVKTPGDMLKAMVDKGYITEADAANNQVYQFLIAKVMSDPHFSDPTGSREWEYEAVYDAMRRAYPDMFSDKYWSRVKDNIKDSLDLYYSNATHGNVESNDAEENIPMVITNVLGGLAGGIASNAGIVG
jgi:hypothetical protein